MQLTRVRNSGGGYSDCLEALGVVDSGVGGNRGRRGELA